MKTLRIDNGLVKELSRSLRPDDGEHPLELLPELQKLTCPGSEDAGDVFMAFIDARQNAGRPVTLVHPSPRSVAVPASAYAWAHDYRPPRLMERQVERVTCPICMNCVDGVVDSEGGDDLRLLPCKAKHVFHQACVDRWPLELSSSSSLGSSSCPICGHGKSPLVFATCVWILRRVVFGSCRLPCKR